MSCQKDEIPLTGTLKVRFTNTESKPYNEINLKIYVIGSTDIPLKILKLDSNGETEKTELIYGSYILEYANNLYIKRKLIQIKPDENVYLVIDYKND